MCPQSPAIKIDHGHSAFLIEVPMPGYYKKASPLPISVMQRSVLEQIIQRQKSRQDHARRARMILYSSAGLGIGQVSGQVGADRKTVSTWRKRWLAGQEALKVMEAQGDRSALSDAVLSLLSDAPRPGTPVTYSAQVVSQIVAISCEAPKACGYPISHWTPQVLREEVIARGIVKDISVRSVGRFLKRGRS